MDIAWPDFAAALGLLLVIEGLLPFLSPTAVRHLLAAVATSSDAALRIAGAVSLVSGLAVLWLARS
jgi:uncharacterized protein YjeT (DUF2065 family)